MAFINKKITWVRQDLLLATSTNTGCEEVLGAHVVLCFQLHPRACCWEWDRFSGSICPVQEEIFLGFVPLLFTWASQNGLEYSIMGVLALLSSSALTWAAFWGR